MAGTLPHVDLPESEEYSDYDRPGRMSQARLFYAIHNNFSKKQVADKFRLIGPDESCQYATDAGFYQATLKQDWNGWREGYRELVAKDLERRGRQHLTAQLARNRKFGEKMGEMLDTIDTDASNEWNPKKRTGNIDAIATLQRSHSINTTELLQIYELPTSIQKHTGQLDDLNDPVALRERAQRLLEAAKSELDGNGTDASGSGTVGQGEDSAGGAGSGAVSGA